MADKPVYTVGRYPNSKIKQATPTCLLQAQSLGYVKRSSPSLTPYSAHIPVIAIHETASGFQIELDEA